MLVMYTLILALSALLFSAAGTYALSVALPKFSIMDEPGERNNHATLTPRGAGIAVTLVTVGFLLVAQVSGGLLWGLLLAGGISLLDDVRGLSPKIRLLGHLAAIFLALGALGDGLVFQGLLPFWVDRILVVLIWLWFTNLYNFMDGIDEITAMQTACLCGGIVCIALVAPELSRSFSIYSVITLGAVIGFWLFNRHPAKIFLGDVGSIPLGLLMGFLLLKLAAAGAWQAALIMPAYYLTDATSTLISRILSRENIWQSHSRHAYQQGVRQGRTHWDVTSRIFGLNMVLIVMAALSTLDPYVGMACMAFSYAMCLLLMLHFYRRPKASRNAPPMVAGNA